MPVRLKKLVGSFLLVTVVIVYAVLATLYAVAQLAESGALVHLAYFFLTGLLWVLPAMWIIKWMVTEPRR
jgi:CHASE3 domain sensor protein